MLRILLWDSFEPVATLPGLEVGQCPVLLRHGFQQDTDEVFDAHGTIIAAYDYSPYGAVTGYGRTCSVGAGARAMSNEELAPVYYIIDTLVL